MKKIKNYFNVLILIFLTLVCFQGTPDPISATITVPYSVDYTNDHIGANNISNGAIKKVEGNTIYLATIATYLQSNWYGSSEPDSPVAGQIWYDSSVGYLKKYDGATWTAVAAAAGISDLSEDTSPSLGGNLDQNQFSLVLDPTPTSDHTYNGKIETQTAGENLVIGDVCYLKSADGKFWKCDADAEATSAGMIRMATTSISADAAGVFLIEGYIRDDTWNWAAVGEELYISVTPGNPTETAPTGDGDIQRIMGHAQSADIIYFNPSQAYVEVEA